MNKEMIELIDNINGLKAEVKSLAEENKLDQAKAKKEELINAQKKLDLIYDLEKENKVTNISDMTKVTGNITEETAFVNALKSEISKKPIDKESREVLNMMKVKTPEDGGLTVPEDVRTNVVAFRKTKQALENYVTVKAVSETKGTQVIEKRAEHVPFDNVDESADFPEVPTPQFEKINYEVKKKGGVLQVTREIVKDSDISIVSYLTGWIADKARATRNFLVLKVLDENKTSKEVAISGVDDLKRIFNITLDPVFRDTSIIMTNQDGYQWLDTLKDSDGNYALQPNVTQKSQHVIFGNIPVVVISNSLLKTKDNKIPFYCGDLKETVTIFDYESLTIETSNEAGDLWNKDLIGFKVRERLDCKIFDETAFVKAELNVATVTPPTSSISVESKTAKGK